MSDKAKEQKEKAQAEREKKRLETLRRNKITAHISIIRGRQ